MTGDRFLRIYLNDHLAVATAGVELATRCSNNNKGSDLGDYLERLVAELAEDRAALESVMHALGLRPSRAKGAAAWAAEKVGRLKPNGQLTGYSDLSRVIELEALWLTIEANVLLWRNLMRLGDAEPRLASVDFAQLVERGRDQTSRLDAHRQKAADKALGLDRELRA